MKGPSWLEVRRVGGELVVEVRVDTPRKLLAFAWEAAAGFSGWRRPAAFALVVWWYLTGQQHRLLGGLPL